MSVAICIPAERPQHFERIVSNIAETTPEPHAVYWVVGTDEAAAELTRLGQTFWQDEGASWGVRANFMFTQTTEPYLFIGSDDSLWHAGWLTAVLDMMYEIDGIVMVNDLLNPVGTLPLVSRNYIDTMSGCIDESGVIFHSGYRHAYTETEAQSVARARGRYGYCAGSIVEHLHPGIGKGQSDLIYDIGNASMGPGVELYRSRAHLWESITA